ncbi:MAG: biliverdin-producing heme oxygenase, partial [Phycisphaerales bacterium]|nr:biliverdin-producing heme oxygenase [Phycisphaerales bacterium]
SMSTTAVDLPQIMDRLRAETRDAHDATEAIPFSAAMIQDRLPKAAYVGQLLAYAIVHRSLDRALATSNDATVAAVWHDDLAKVPLLDADVAYFAAEIDGVAPDAVAAAEDWAAEIRRLATSRPVALLGYLYVLEGSTLGATILRQHVALMYRLDLDQPRGLQYYSPYGNAVMPHWKAFKERMNAAITDPDDQSRVLDAAREAFGRVGTILQALSVDLDETPAS